MPTAPNSPAPARILVVTTGGTIEALYNPEEGTPHHVPVPGSRHESCIPAALAKMGVDAGCEFWPLDMRDSKKIITATLDAVLARAGEEDFRRVVIVHGTDTMPANARYMERRVAEWGAERAMDERVFVFTGAMSPLRDKHGQWRDASDGWENLRRALHDTAEAKPGVYVEMGQGPQSPRSIKKTVVAEGGVVKHSAFVADDPERHEEHGLH